MLPLARFVPLPLPLPLPLLLPLPLPAVLALALPCGAATPWLPVYCGCQAAAAGVAPLLPLLPLAPLPAIVGGSSEGAAPCLALLLPTAARTAALAASASLFACSHTL